MCFFFFSLSLSLAKTKQSDIGFFRKVMTLAILRGERVPTEEEAFLEDGGAVPSNAPAWWDPPQEEEDDDDDSDDDADDVDDDEDEEEDGGGWESGENEEEAGPGDGGEEHREAGGGGGQKLDRMMFEGGVRGEDFVANGFGNHLAQAAEGAPEEQQAHAVGRLDVNLSSESNGAWPTFPGEHQSNSNGGGTPPVWATASTIE